jgi:aspartate/tyrosine/aromatic aminotransferase
MSSGSSDSFDKPVESVWARLEPAPADPVFGLIHNFIDDTNPQKVLLGVGAYRDD